MSPAIKSRRTTTLDGVETVKLLSNFLLIRAWIPRVARRSNFEAAGSLLHFGRRPVGCAIVILKFPLEKSRGIPANVQEGW